MKRFARMQKSWVATLGKLFEQVLHVATDPKRPPPPFLKEKLTEKASQRFFEVLGVPGP